jgi:hypothetical protein
MPMAMPTAMPTATPTAMTTAMPTAAKPRWPSCVTGRTTLSLPSCFAAIYFVENFRIESESVLLSAV